MEMVNQLADFTAEVSSAAEKLRYLDKSHNTFIWTAQHDQAFQNVTAALVSLPALACFNTALPKYSFTHWYSMQQTAIYPDAEMRLFSASCPK